MPRNSLCSQNDTAEALLNILLQSILEKLRHQAGGLSRIGHVVVICAGVETERLLRSLIWFNIVGCYLAARLGFLETGSWHWHVLHQDDSRKCSRVSQ